MTPINQNKPYSVIKSSFLHFLCSFAALISLVLPLQNAFCSPAVDFNGDGIDEIPLWNPDTGVFTIVSTRGNAGSTTSLDCGLTGDVPLSGDFNADGKAEPTIWRPQAFPLPGLFIGCDPVSPFQVPIGSAGDIPITTGDWDGNEVNDLALFRPTTGEWFKTIPPGLVTTAFGQLGDIPVPADYDGDGITDEAVHRPATAQWFFKKSTTGSTVTIEIGTSSDIPVVGDYDGDGKADPALWQPHSGTWFILLSSSNKLSTSVVLGESGDRPVPADLDGDGKTEPAVFRPYTGKIFYVGNLLSRSAVGRLDADVPNDYPVNPRRVLRATPNDFDRDGRSDFTVIRSLDNFPLWLSADSAGGFLSTVQWGLRADTKLARDFTGDGRMDRVTVRDFGEDIHWFVRPSGELSAYTVLFGKAGDILIPGDFDADTRADFAVVRPLASGDLSWNILTSLSGQTITRNWGLFGDQVIDGDYNGDGTQDLSVVRPIGRLLYWFTLAVHPIKLLEEDSIHALPMIQWGITGDTLAPGDYDGDGITDYGVIRDFGGQLFLLVRLATGEALDPIPWGLAGDKSFTTNFRANALAQPTVWRPVASDNSTLFVINNAPLGELVFPWGFPTDEVLTSQGAAVAPGTPPPPPPAELDCSQTLPNSDGSGGYVHKPISEGDGKLVVLLNARFAGQTSTLKLAAGGKIIETTRFVGETNGNRPTFRASQPGKNYPANLLEIFTLNTGENICIEIPTPGTRYD